MSERGTVWGLRFLALVLAVIAWIIISLGQREKLSEQALQCQVRYNNSPANLIILNPVQSVQVRLSGPESVMANLNPFQVSVPVDLTGAVKGIQEVQLRPQTVNRPQGIEVVGIEPTSFSIELDELITEFRPVRARLAGEPAAGAVVKETRVVPSPVAIRGPETVLRGIESLTTRAVSLDGHAIDFQERTLIEVPGPLVQMLQEVVTVNVVLEVPSAASALQESPAL